MGTPTFASFALRCVAVSWPQGRFLVDVDFQRGARPNTCNAGEREREFLWQNRSGGGQLRRQPLPAKPDCGVNKFVGVARR
jgi:hypothetical protein